MFRSRLPIVLLSFAIGTFGAAGASAQDFADTQTLTSRVLLARQRAAHEQQATQERRLEELERITQQQAALLQAQADTIRDLKSELQQIKGGQ